MSTENRNKVLLGFGALVAVVIVAIALWPANFRKEDASGAIGAVQKHRAPQITQKDVILGDENVRHQQKVLYADFLADATNLRAMAASRNYSAATELANELRTRYAAEADAALAEAVEMASRVSADREKLQSEIAEVQSRLAAHKAELSSEDMKELNTKLALIVVICQKEIAAKSASRILSDADREFVAAAKQLETAKLENEYAAASKQVADAEALMSRPVASISLADEVAYLNAIQMEMKVAADAEQLAARQLADEQMASRLNAAAVELEAKALSNIKASAELMSEMAAKLNDIDAAIAQASRIVGSRAAMESRSTEALSKNLAAARQTLLSREDEFYARSRAVANEEQLAAKTLNSAQLQNQLANLQTRLQARQQP
ncbi:MAG TPA: hypothetical protein VII12_07260 [Thermoanaerobaculia bacterium]